MRKGKLILGMLLLLGTMSCVKEKAEEIAEKATTFEDIKVPENFDYSSTKTSVVTIKIENPETLTMFRYVVKIYDKSPSEGGKLFISGTVNTTDYTYSPTITVPISTVQVWVVVYLGDEIIKQGMESL